MKPIRGVLLDLSGVLYVGDAPLAGALEALTRLQASGLPVRYITNTTRSPRREIHRMLSTMGFRIPEQEIFTAPGAVRAALERDGLKPLLLIHPGLAPEFQDLVTDTPDAVVLGDAGEAFSYDNLNRAFRLLMDGAPLLAMGSNRYFREQDGLSLDIGPFLRALEYAAGVQGTVLGKPSAEFFHAAVADMGLEPDEVLMVGDDAEADVQGALDADIQACLVRTGKYRPGDEDHIDTHRARIADDLAALVADLLA
ncbi:HAD-superfamily subfamily IIA hydrolase like protein [Thioalkalivibrio sulfidiphilus HL-EbGr7]|uniref:Phospholysine phosphohistidine inorganic pyrophosphate phosphatase n=1 Tax=Thioalkalivibrio sulfidiphilus (strain HL-EbGR7) TaxID=396588 RepID=B8GU99_THISH|nr:TIGR01458 family HAD-type hydrolase [Thioalkalivibrio sulfidiphilus]ACL71382.1 HAD-superfamily subfamily IIA hydrolase like protein [Thioalkalivibrio sulfidiphilus HL-EbGr7]